MITRRTVGVIIFLCLLLGGCNKRPQKIVVQPAPPPPGKVVSPPAPSPPKPAPVPVRSSLDVGEESFEAGRYADAAVSYESYLAGRPDAQDRDKAVFKLGLAYALVDQSPEGISKAQDQFRTLVRLFPKSRYRSEAEYILSLQTGIEKAQADLRKRSANARGKDERIRDMNEKLKERDEKIRQLTQELDRMKKIDLERRPSRQPN
jgi:TolA-binding protein